MAIFLQHYQDACDPEFNKTETNQNRTTVNPERTQEVDVSSFSVVSTEALQELTSVVVNKNTPRSPKQWINVSRSSCQSRHLENVTTETMAPEELNKILSKFHAEIKKKKDGDDYEPESL